MEKALTFEFIEINLVLLSLGGQKLRGQESGVDVCVHTKPSWRKKHYFEQFRATKVHEIIESRRKKEMKKRRLLNFMQRFLL